MKRAKRSSEMQALRDWLNWRLSETVKAERRAKRARHYGEALYASGLASAYAFAILHMDRVARAAPGSTWEEPKSRVRRRRRMAS
jgi:hypothetical protein